jgi:tetratricopeptide (TPR) repeat protein
LLCCLGHAEFWWAEKTNLGVKEAADRSADRFMNAAAPRPQNPYVAGNPVGGGPAFVGRNTLLRYVARILENPEHQAVVLYGQRRIGKTSILQQLSASLAKQGAFQPVYFDLQDKAKRPLREVVVSLAHSIAEALGLPAPVPDGDPEAWFRSEWLPSILGEPSNSASLVILFDEFDVLADVRAEHAAMAFFPYLRDLLREARGRVRCIFVIGRNIDDLASIAKALFKGLPAERVGLLDRRDADALIRMSEANGSLSWENEAVEEAWALTSGHPFLLQNLCWQVWEHVHESAPARPRATASDIEACVPRTLDTARNALGWLWDGLSPAGRVVASALAGAGNRAISQEDLENLLHESGVRVVMRELRDAPQLLEEWDLIEPIDGGYRFRVELLRRWIARFRPLTRVQIDLDQILPRAETLYQAGKWDYEAGDIDKAEARLSEALAINPSHARASELLADILISRQQWERARALLEQLHDINPPMARARLGQVLVGLAGAADREDEKLALLDRALQISPKLPAAEAARRQVFRERGDRARAAGRLEEAIEIYRAAGLADLEKQVGDDLRRRDCDVLMQSATAFEQRGAYSEAYQELMTLAERFPDLRDWKDDLARIEEAAFLQNAYREVEEATYVGDKATARRKLVSIVTRDPAYRDVTARLHAIVTGVDVDALARQLQFEKAVHAQTEEKRAAAEHALHAGFEAEERRLREAAQSGSAARQRITELEATLSREREAASAAELLSMTANARLKEFEKQLEQQERESGDHVQQATYEIARLKDSVGRWQMAIVGTATVALGLGFVYAVTQDNKLTTTRTDLNKARNDLGTTQDDLRTARAAASVATASSDKERKRSERLVLEGPLAVIDAKVTHTEKGADGKCAEHSPGDEVSSKGACAVRFSLTLRNNLTDIKIPKGPLCVKFILPNKKVDVATGDTHAVAAQGGSPCSYGILFNEEVSGKKHEMIKVALDQETVPLESGWGEDPSGTRYGDQPGEHEIEFWWEQKRIGTTRFIVGKATNLVRTNPFDG